MSDVEELSLTFTHTHTLSLSLSLSSFVSQFLSCFAQLKPKFSVFLVLSLTYICDALIETIIVYASENIKKQVADICSLVGRRCGQ